MVKIPNERQALFESFFTDEIISSRNDFLNLAYAGKNLHPQTTQRLASEKRVIEKAHESRRRMYGIMSETGFAEAFPEMTDILGSDISEYAKMVMVMQRLGYSRHRIREFMLYRKSEIR